MANRIAGGIFFIDHRRYCVPINNGPNHLHGGFRGYDKRIWTADAAMTADGPSLRLSLVDPDGAEGYPGPVNVTVIYSVTGDNALKIQYYATSDKATPINLTNHTYFNLKGRRRFECRRARSQNLCLTIHAGGQHADPHRRDCPG